MCRTKTNALEKAWCLLYGMCLVYGKAALNALDWMGAKLVDLIDHNDFFAGSVWTLAAVLILEILTKK